MAVPELVKCQKCGNEQAFKVLTPLICQACGATWLEPIYNYAAFKREVLRGLRGHSYDIWRYADVLPVNEPATLDLRMSAGPRSSRPAGGVGLLATPTFT